MEMKIESRSKSKIFLGSVAPFASEFWNLVL